MSEEKKEVVKKKVSKVSKAQKAKAKKDEQEIIDDDRMQNASSTVSTSIGEFELKELAFFPFIKLMRKQIEIFYGVLKQLDFTEGVQMPPEKIVDLLTAFSYMEDFEENMCEIIAAYAQTEDKEQFMNLKTSDMKIIIPAIFDKVDKEALKDFFTQTLPSLGKQMQTKMQNSTD